MNERRTLRGTVQRVLLNKGYCFIRGEDRGSYFAHAKSFIPPYAFDTIREGTPVTFQSRWDDRGPRAEEVVVG